MSYESVWGMGFAELRSMGYRPLCDQAWAGASNDHQVLIADYRAEKLGLHTCVSLTRAELHTRFRYSFDLSGLAGHHFDFRWSLLATGAIDWHFAFDNARSWRNIPVDARAAYGYFPDEAAATAWKMAVS